MKKKFIIASAILCTIIIICASPAFTKTWARVGGTVTGEKGKPIAGARVILIFSEDGTKYELTTDEQGKWFKGDMRPGAWTIGFMAEGYIPDNINIVLSAIKENPPLDINLKPTPRAPLRKADNLYQQKKYAEALQEYQRVLADNQNLYQAYEKIGLCHYRLDDLENAVKYFKMMLEKKPDSREVLINLSAIYFEKGSLEEGMKYFKQLDEESLEDPNVFYNIGILFFGQGQTDQAIDYFKKCTARDANYLNAYNQLAMAYLNKGDMEEAKKNFKKVIQLAPESEMAAQAKEILDSLN